MLIQVATAVIASVDLTQILHVQDVCIARSNPDLVDALLVANPDIGCGHAQSGNKLLPLRPIPDISTIGVGPDHHGVVSERCRCR